RLRAVDRTRTPKLLALRCCPSGQANFIQPRSVYAAGCRSHLARAFPESRARSNTPPSTHFAAAATIGNQSEFKLGTIQPMRTALEQRVLDFIRESRMASAGDRVGVAVSGGADSVALMRLLESLSGEL